MQHYAIDNPSVAISLKKHGSMVCEFQSARMSSLDIIRSIYGKDVQQELVLFNHSATEMAYTASGYVSNANFNHKKSVFILFINS